jgi:O-succinylbenzoate synthase
MSDVHFWRYTLRSASRLNAVSGRKEHPGSLIRVDGGYGCLHPWPGLGDLTIEEQLAALAAGESTPLIRQALRCAAEDAAARREGRSLFASETPESHWLVLTDDVPPQGFRKVKLKVGPEMPDCVRSVRRWAEDGFQVRLDANETFSFSGVEKFWQDLGSAREQVEWFEDPVPWNREIWAELGEMGMPIAVDRDAESRFSGKEIVIVKPALSSWIPEAPAKFAVTSYMDHPVGQMWAAAEACRLAAGPDSGRMLVGGLTTDRCFEPDPFLERIRYDGARILSPGGTGLGFDDLLEALPWERLI